MVSVAVDVPASTAQKVQAPKSSSRPEPSAPQGGFAALVDANVQADAAATPATAPPAPRSQGRAIAPDRDPVRPARAGAQAEQNAQPGANEPVPVEADAANPDSNSPAGSEVTGKSPTEPVAGENAPATSGDTAGAEGATTDAAATADVPTAAPPPFAGFAALFPTAVPVSVPLGGQAVNGTAQAGQSGDEGGIKPLSIATAAVNGQLPLAKVAFQAPDATTKAAIPAAPSGEMAPANADGAQATANAAALGAVATAGTPGMTKANPAAAKATPGEPTVTPDTLEATAGSGEPTMPVIRPAGATQDPAQPSATPAVPATPAGPATQTSAATPATPAIPAAPAGSQARTKSETDATTTTTPEAAAVEAADQTVSDVNLVVPETRGRTPSPKPQAQGKPAATISADGTTVAAASETQAGPPAASTDTVAKPLPGVQPGAAAPKENVTADAGKPQAADGLRDTNASAPHGRDAAPRESVSTVTNTAPAPDQGLTPPSGIQPTQPSAQATAVTTANLTATAAGPAVAVPLSALAVEIAATARSGKSRFEIRLDPAELGRIDVRIDVDRHGQMSSHLTVEKPETLAMLRQDAPQLQRALDDAGFKTGNGGLQFSLRDQSSSGQNNDNSGNGNARRLIITEDETVPVAIAGRSYGRNLSANGGVDIRV